MVEEREQGRGSETAREREGMTGEGESWDTLVFMAENFENPEDPLGDAPVRTLGVSASTSVHLPLWDSESKEASLPVEFGERGSWMGIAFIWAENTIFLVFTIFQKILPLSMMERE